MTEEFNEKIISTLNNICTKNHLFHFEEHFQLKMAEEIAKKNSKFKVYIEEPFRSKSIDIVVKDDTGDSVYAIELKYVIAMTNGVSSRIEEINDRPETLIKYTKKFKNNKSGDGYQRRRYSFWYDVEKLQKYCKNTGCVGYAIFFTNDERYWGKVNDNNKDVNFSMENGRSVDKTTLYWKDEDKKYPPIEVTNNYTMVWRPSCKIKSEFRYLALRVPPNENEDIIKKDF